MRAISDCLLIVATIQLQHPILVVACSCAGVELAFQYAVQKIRESESPVSEASISIRDSLGK